MDFKSLSDPIVLVGEESNKPSFFSKIRPPSTHLFTNKKFLGGALTVFLIFAVGVGVYLSQQPTELEPQANEEINQRNITIPATDSGRIRNP